MSAPIWHKPRPLWRWWLFSVGLSLWFRFSWRWALNLVGWCVLPEWLSDSELDAIAAYGEAPF